MGNVREIMKGANQVGNEAYRREIQRRSKLVSNIGTHEIPPQRETRVPKREISNRPNTVKNKPYKGKKSRRILAAGAAALIFLGAITGMSSERKENTPTQPVSYTIVDQYSNKEELETIDEVKEDFIKQYLEAYNKMCYTNYSSAKIYVNYLSGEGLYKLEDGRPVTRGSHPYETEKALKQIGDFEIVNGYRMLLQIVSKEGKILGSYNTSTGEFVYSGNQLGDLTEVIFDEPTLEKLGISKELLRTVTDVVTSKGQNEKSTKIYINRYEEAKKAMEENNKSATRDYDGDER